MEQAPGKLLRAAANVAPLTYPLLVIGQSRGVAARGDHDAEERIPPVFDDAPEACLTNMRLLHTTPIGRTGSYAPART